jgi:hypothetical protein
MELTAAWDLFIKFIWPLVLLYAGYLHTQMGRLMQKFESLQEEHYRFQAHAAKEYVTHTTVASLEDKITRKLDRIDDKITKILENHK